MATISLRAYDHEIEGMIDSAQIEEAVAHCRHILATFPKHIHTYRLLGKAFLESRRFSDAADIFQRVLSVVPDDFVANVGMSIIREDERNLDAAIWHMERAYEAQPSNTAIKEELRRLYGRRDGIEPPKVRLTRGALARMYAKSDLYDQAIAEIRAGLSEDPQRPDLQVLLTKMLYQSGQKVEAVEACSNLINKFPYCFEANRILSLILPQTERAEEAKTYQERTNAMDPYLAHIGPQATRSEDVPEGAVTIDRLVYRPGEVTTQAAAQPSWAASLGVAFEEEGTEPLPEWLQEGDMPAIPAEGAKAVPVVAPFSWEEPQAGSEPETPAQAPEESIPGWMKEAGWQRSTGQEEEIHLSVVPETPFEMPEGEIARAEIPDWLKEIAPSGALEEELPPLEEESGETVLPWLQETPPGASDTIITWLKEEKGEELSSAEVPEVETPASAVTPEAEMPDWLKDLEKPSEEQPESVPPATQALESIPPAEESPTLGQEPSQEVVPQTPEHPEEGSELPDWLRGLEQPVEERSGVTDWLKETPGEPAPETPPSSDQFPDWLSGFEQETPKSQAAVETPEVKGEEELPDWIKGAEAAAASTGLAAAGELPDWLKGEEPVSSQPVPEVEEPVPPAAEEKPEWLSEITPIEVGAAAPEAPIPAEPTAEMPEWLRETAPAEAEAAALVVPPTAPEAPGIDLSDQDAALAWLESLAAQHGAKEEELITPPEERLETPPDWVLEAVPEEPPQSPIETPAAGLETETPEWLKETEPVEAIPTPEEAAPSTAEEIPEWLREVTPAEIEAATPELPTTPEPTAEMPEWLRETTPAEAEASAPVVTPAAPEATGIDLNDQDAALAWLESLAVQHGAKEEELITPPEERLETPPEWVREAVQEEPPQPLAEAPTVSLEAETPEWLKEPEQVEAEPAPEEAAPPTAEEIPEWLREAAPAEVEAAAIEPPTIQEKTAEIPEWLQEPALAELEKPITPPVEEISPQEAPITPPEPEVPPEIPVVPEAPSGELIPEQIDINTAYLRQLESLPGIGYVLAQTILAHRDTYGQFASVDDLEKISGISPHLVNEIRNLITVGGLKEAVVAIPEVIPSDAEDILAQARQSIKENNITQAIEGYASLIKKTFHLEEIITDLEGQTYQHPLDVNIWQTLGDAYVRTDKLEEALSAYTKAEELLR